MGKITEGRASFEVPDDLMPPAKAGKLTAAEKKRIPKVRPGIGLACNAAASGIELAGDAFETPKGITPEGLRALGAKAEGIDLLISDAEALLERLRQANLIFDAEAAAALGKVNDRVRELAKKDGSLKTAFAGLLSYYEQAPKKKRQNG